ncbi:MAG: serine hydrolase domain-containing protein [Homoserinimonas sp.]
MTSPETRLTTILDRYAARPDTGQVTFALSRPSTDWSFSYGGDDQYFAASISKLYITAVILQLRGEGLIALDEPIKSYLGDDLVDGLHTLRGTDHSGNITVRHLLSHTSGIAGYFDEKRRGANSLYEDVLREDRAVSFDEAVRVAKEELAPHFPPGTPGKAFYSDTNFQLLGRIIELVTGSPVEDAVVDRIVAPLGLNGSWPFTPADIPRYGAVAPILNGRAVIHIPRMMASARAQGGMVSTARDGIAFLRAFLTGQLFPAADLEEMRDWNRIFFPLQYGTGLMRYSMSRLLSVGSGPREFIGHSGSTGSFLFYAPSADLYLSGTVNQIQKRALVYQLGIRLAGVAAKA